MNKVVFGCLLLLAPLLAGCWAEAIKGRATADLSCPEAQLAVRTVSSYKAVYDVQGCGKQATYVVRGGQPMLDSPVAGPDAPPAPPAPTDSMTAPTQPAPAPPAPQDAMPDGPERAY